MTSDNSPMAVAERLSALMTEEHLQGRAKRASRVRYEAASAQVPDVEPEPCDKIKPAEDGFRLAQVE